MTEELLPYQGDFACDVSGDPAKDLERRYGIGTSGAALLNPGAWTCILKGNLAKTERSMPKGMAGGGPFGLPADFLACFERFIRSVRYGRHADSQRGLDQLLTKVQPGTRKSNANASAGHRAGSG